MPISADFREYLADLLSGFGPARFKRAFGFDAIVADDVMLGMIIDGRIYLRTDAQSRGPYEAEGGKPFAFRKRNGEWIVTSYLSIPDRLLDEPDEFVTWVQRARAAALESPTAKKKRAKRAQAEVRPQSVRKNHRARR